MADELMTLSDAENPVAFFANGIGDAIFTLPALRALAGLFPERLTLITHESTDYLALLGVPPMVRQLKIKSGTKCDWDREELDKLAASVGACDLFVSLVAWHSSSLGYLIKRLRPAQSVGYCDGYDIHLPRDYTKHTAELIFDAVRAIAPRARLTDHLAPPSYPLDSVRMAQEIKKCLGDGVRLLAVHMETLPEKVWDAAKLAASLDQFLSSHSEYLAVLVNYSDFSLSLPSEANRERLIAQRGLSLADALSIVHHADLFLGADSCMLHAADFGRVPAVGLFGPTSAHEFGFLVGPHIVIQSPSDINRIEVESVVAAMESLHAEPHQRALWQL
jgi:ADP-heptose:LPS heptosyltransferase